MVEEQRWALQGTEATKEVQEVVKRSGKIGVAVVDADAVVEGLDIVVAVDIVG